MPTTRAQISPHSQQARSEIRRATIFPWRASALGKPSENSQNFGCVLNREARKVAQLNDTALLRVGFMKTLERVVKRDQIQIFFVRAGPCSHRGRA